MHSVNSNLADEEADELRSLSTMDTLTFRRLRDGRQRKKSKQSDNEDDHDDDGVSSVSKLTFASRDSSSRRRMNIRTIHNNNNNNDDDDDDGESRMGDTLTTLTNASGGSRWSRYRGNGSISRGGGRNSRGEASVANTSRRCIVDICLLAVLGIVLFVKFGSVELELRGNLSKLRGGTVDAVDSSSHYPTDGAGYAQMLVRQGNLQEYDGTDNLKRNNDHDEAEAFFDRAIHDLKNGVVPAQVNGESLKERHSYSQK